MTSDPPSSRALPRSVAECTPIVWIYTETGVNFCEFRRGIVEK